MKLVAVVVVAAPLLFAFGRRLYRERRGGPLLAQVWVALSATLLSLLVGSMLILAVGSSPLEVYRLLLAGTWGNLHGISQVFFKATPLALAGLSFTIAFRAGLFNIGIEGQLTLGAFAMALTGAYVRGPSWLVVPLCLVASAVAGAVPAALAGLFKATRGAHEVITTMMLNFVVRAAMVGVGPLVFVRESTHTVPILAAAELPRLSLYFPSLHGSALNAGLLIAVVAALLVGWLLWRTPLGFSLRAVGLGADAAEASGVRTGRAIITAMALSGAMAGLVGASFVLGYKRYYEDGFSGGVGFMGIAVAVLGGARPVGVLVAALALGTLSEGGLCINSVVPKEIVDVLQATVIFAAVAMTPLSRRLFRLAEAT